MLVIFTPKPAPPLLKALILAPAHDWTLLHDDAMPLVTYTRRVDHAGGVELLHGAAARGLAAGTRVLIARQIAALDRESITGAFGIGTRPAREFCQAPVRKLGHGADQQST